MSTAGSVLKEHYVITLWTGGYLADRSYPSSKIIRFTFPDISFDSYNSVDDSNQTYCMPFSLL